MTRNRVLVVLAAAALAILVAGPVSALTVEVTLDTSGLVGHAAGPFSLNFQLTDGSGLGDGNNVVNIGPFDFGGGAPAGAPTLTGGAAGSLATTVALSDTAFLSDFVQPFTPGASLRFGIASTTNLDASGTPDLFTFAILDSTGAELPTTGSFFDVFVAIELDSARPTVQAFGGDPSRAPAAGGPPIGLAAPGIALVPGPASLVLLVFSAWALGLRRGFRLT